MEKLGFKKGRKSLLVDAQGKPLELSSDGYGYQSADENRYNLDFTLMMRSAPALILSSARRMRARAQDLERNNDHVKRFLSLLTNNVIGWNGIRLQSKATRSESTDTPDRPAIKLIEAAWLDWAGCDTCSAEGEDDWIEIQKIILRRMVVDGEIFVEMMPGFDNDYNFAVRLWEADSVPLGFSDEKRNIHMGIEYDSWMRPVAYHVQNNGFSLPLAYDEPKLIRIPAENMRHVYRKERPRQKRGFTYLCSTSERMYMLAKFEKATIIGAQIASSKMGFFRDTDEFGAEGYEGDGPENPDDVSGPNVIDINPGQFEDIGRKEFTAFDVEYPPAGYAEYVHEVLRSASSGLNISYHLLANDPGSVNYSTAREFRLQDTDLYRDFQHWFARKVNNPVFRFWLKIQMLAGPLSKYRQADYRRLAQVKWQPRGWQWVDPAKEGQGNQLAFQLGSKSLTDIAAEQGRDFEEVVEQIQRDMEYAKEHGLDLTGLMTSPILFPAEAPEENNPPTSEPTKSGNNRDKK